MQHVPEGETSRAASLVGLMLLAVAIVAALAFWDEQRESAAALDDFAQEQATLADSVASELATRLAAARRDALFIAESLAEGRRPPAPAFEGYTSYALRPAGEAPREPGGAGVTLSVPAPGGHVIDLVMPPARLLEGALRVEKPGAVRLLVQGPQGGSCEAPTGGQSRANPSGARSTRASPPSGSSGRRPPRSASGRAAPPRGWASSTRARSAGGPSPW